MSTISAPLIISNPTGAASSRPKSGRITERRERITGGRRGEEEIPRFALLSLPPPSPPPVILSFSLSPPPGRSRPPGHELLQRVPRAAAAIVRARLRGAQRLDVGADLGAVAGREGLAEQVVGASRG
jgi:hypothetical protein